MIAHTFDGSTQEAETGGSLCIQGQGGLHNKFQARQGYIERPCLRNRNKKLNYERETWALTYEKYNRGKPGRSQQHHWRSTGANPQGHLLTVAPCGSEKSQQAKPLTLLAELGSQ